MRWRWQKVSDPPEGSSDYWARLHVRNFVEEIEGSENESHAYLTAYGLRCPSGEQQRRIVAAVTDGDIDWDISWIERTNPNDHPWRIRKHFTEVDTEGFWYRGGRIIYATTAGANEKEDHTSDPPSPADSELF